MTNRKLLSPSPLKDKYAHTNFFRSSKDAIIGRYTIGLSSTAKKRKNKKKGEKRKNNKIYKQLYNLLNLRNPNTRTQHSFLSSKTQYEANRPKQYWPKPIKPKKGKQKKAEKQV